jgi:hypothetical protein
MKITDICRSQSRQQRHHWISSFSWLKRAKRANLILQEQRSRANPPTRRAYTRENVHIHWEARESFKDHILARRYTRASSHAGLMELGDFGIGLWATHPLLHHTHCYSASLHLITATIPFMFYGGLSTFLFVAYATYYSFECAKRQPFHVMYKSKNAKGSKCAVMIILGFMMNTVFCFYQSDVEDPARKLSLLPTEPPPTPSRKSPPQQCGYLTKLTLGAPQQQKIRSYPTTSA